MIKLRMIGFIEKKYIKKKISEILYYEILRKYSVLDQF